MLIQIPRHLMIWKAEGREAIHSPKPGEFQEQFLARQQNLSQEQ